MDANDVPLSNLGHLQAVRRQAAHDSTLARCDCAQCGEDTGGPTLHGDLRLPEHAAPPADRLERGPAVMAGEDISRWIEARIASKSPMVYSRHGRCGVCPLAMDEVSPYRRLDYWLGRSVTPSRPVKHSQGHQFIAVLHAFQALRLDQMPVGDVRLVVSCASSTHTGAPARHLPTMLGAFAKLLRRDSTDIRTCQYG